MAVLVGACVGWAAAVHLGDDVRVSREVRDFNRGRLEAVEAVLPKDAPSAVFAFFTSKDAMGPLQLRRDVIIADPGLDKARTADTLIRELRARGRRVFVLRAGMPAALFARLVHGHPHHLVRRSPPIFELR